MLLTLLPFRSKKWDHSIEIGHLKFQSQPEKRWLGARLAVLWRRKDMDSIIQLAVSSRACSGSPSCHYQCLFREKSEPSKAINGKFQTKIYWFLCFFSPLEIKQTDLAGHPVQSLPVLLVLVSLKKSLVNFVKQNLNLISQHTMSSNLNACHVPCHIHLIDTVN